MQHVLKSSMKQTLILQRLLHFLFSPAHIFRFSIWPSLGDDEHQTPDTALFGSTFVFWLEHQTEFQAVARRQDDFVCDSPDPLNLVAFHRLQLLAMTASHVESLVSFCQIACKQAQKQEINSNSGSDPLNCLSHGFKPLSCLTLLRCSCRVPSNFSNCH